MPKLRVGKDSIRWTPRSREFIKLYRLYGAGLNLKQFCSNYNFSYHSYERWRKGIPSFKEEVNAIREWHHRQGARLFDKEHEEEALVEGGLTRKQAMFLGHYRETYDRVDAIKLVCWSLDEYESNLVEHQEFRDRVRLIDKEADMKVRDALRSGAINGSVAAARKLLEPVKPGKGTTDQESRSQPTVEGIQQSQRLWGQRFGVPTKAAGELPSEVASIADDLRDASQ